MKIFLGTVFVLFSTLAHADYSADKCASQAAQALKTKGVNDITSVYYGFQCSGRHDRVSQYVYWYRVARCPQGHVVVKLTPQCFAMSVYTHGGCIL